jgi:hypothetical protein
MGQWAFELGFAKAPPKLDALIDTTLMKSIPSPGTPGEGKGEGSGGG